MANYGSHLGVDGTRVLSRGRRGGAKAYRSTMEDPAARERVSESARVANGSGPHSYTGESVQDRAFQ